MIEFHEFSASWGKSFNGKLNEFFFPLKTYPSALELMNLSLSLATSSKKYFGFSFLYFLRTLTSMLKNFSGVSLYLAISVGFYIFAQMLLTSFVIFLLIYPSSSSSSLKSLTQNKSVFGDYCLNCEIQIYKTAFNV